MRYRVRATTSGTAPSLALPKAFAEQHPEFTQGRFDAYVIAPGRMLVSAPAEPHLEEEDDPVLQAFLGFLEGQMAARPGLITPFTRADIEGLDELLAGVSVNLDEDLGDDPVP